MSLDDIIRVEKLQARAEVYESCAGHLELDWTDDPAERAQGCKIRDRFYALAKRARAQARRMLDADKMSRPPYPPVPKPNEYETAKTGPKERR
jgi:hypothetical protein